MQETNKIATVGIIGFGNVGFHFAHFFHHKNCLKKVFVRNILALKKEYPLLENLFTNDFNELKNCDLILVCVNDDAVNEIIGQLPSKCIVAHTSGSIGLEQIQRKKNIGVFYPLQTFSKNGELHLKSVPILVESNDKSIEQLLLKFGQHFFDKVIVLDSEKRKLLHLAAVFVNNFTNHLYFQAEDFLQQHQLDFDLLKPLILETAQKIQTTSPKDAQTGPARRKDLSIIDQHKSVLTGTQKTMYEMLTNSILKTYEKL